MLISRGMRSGNSDSSVIGPRGGSYAGEDRSAGARPGSRTGFVERFQRAESGGGANWDANAFAYQPWRICRISFPFAKGTEMNDGGAAVTVAHASHKFPLREGD